MTTDNASALLGRDQLQGIAAGQKVDSHLLSDSLNGSDALSIMRLHDSNARNSGNTGLQEMYVAADNFFAPINDALSGRASTSGDWNYMGSITRPNSNIIGYASTPDVTFKIDGKDVKLSIPSIDPGKTVTFHTNGRQIEARSGDKKWELIYGYNSVTSLLDDGWKWREK